MFDSLLLAACRARFFRTHPMNYDAASRPTPAETRVALESLQKRVVDAALRDPPVDVGPSMAIDGHLRRAELLSGLSGKAFLRHWHSFCSNPIWNFFDGQHVSLAYHAITALQVTVWLGGVAWGQAHDDN